MQSQAHTFKCLSTIAAANPSGDSKSGLTIIIPTNKLKPINDKCGTFVHSFLTVLFLSAVFYK